MHFVTNMPNVSGIGLSFPCNECHVFYSQLVDTYSDHSLGKLGILAGPRKTSLKIVLLVAYSKIFPNFAL